MLASQQARKPRMHQIGWSKRYLGVTDRPVLALINITMPSASRAVTQKKRTILATFIASLQLGTKKTERSEHVLKPYSIDLQARVRNAAGRTALLSRR